MYALVADVVRYPDFLPWCVGATVHASDELRIEASLEMQRSGFRKSFRTVNTLCPTIAMDLSLVDGPFKQLQGGWRFEQLGDAGSKVSLQMKFAFESRATDALFGHYFEESCNKLIDAFVQRARSVYGEV